MLDVASLRKLEPAVIALGSHPGIIQSMLDFDWLAGREKPSVRAILAAGRNNERYFWGEDQVLIPVYEEFEQIPVGTRSELNLLLNVSSGRRTMTSTLQAVAELSGLVGGNLFAEDVPEQHALGIFHKAASDKFFVGPASVGLLLPGKLKLGAIAGVEARQLVEADVFTKGNVAVFSASGGMTNEIINILAQKGKNLSFALSVGGDRFPVLSPAEAFLAAEADPQTEYIVYYGELGGEDEYELVELIKSGKVTKQVYAYIAGSVADMFDKPPQFGHAKAMASKGEESARAKRAALAEVGVAAADSFAAFAEALDGIECESEVVVPAALLQQKLAKIKARRGKLFVSTISGEVNDEVQILGEDLLKFTQGNSFGYVVSSLLLGQKPQSEILPELVEFVFKLLVDHGPYQSGAVNTMITARAGKDLVSALAAGLLTIGPRFGGAINDAAANWLAAVESGIKPADLVEQFAAQRKYIPGIGHKKYRSDNPDPRCSELLAFAEKLTDHRYTDFAQAVAQITTSKKGNLILNVDGVISAVTLDILHSAEGYSPAQLRQLVEAEFFNALFVLPRSIGFVAHYLDQKRIDEGLFRLSPADVGHADRI